MNATQRTRSVLDASGYGLLVGAALGCLVSGAYCLLGVVAISIFTFSWPSNPPDLGLILVSAFYAWLATGPPSVLLGSLTGWLLASVIGLLRSRIQRKATSFVGLIVCLTLTATLLRPYISWIASVSNSGEGGLLWFGLGAGSLLIYAFLGTYVSPRLFDRVVIRSKFRWLEMLFPLGIIIALSAAINGLW